MLDWYQHLPLYISPVAFSIGLFSVRWYALSYVAGFVTVFLALMLSVWKCDHGEIASIFNLEKNQQTFEIRNTIIDFLLISFFAALIGGRIGYVLLYDLPYYLTHPMLVVSPFDEKGMLVGVYGMSYHGALLGVIIASWLFLRIKKINFWQWADFVVPAVALGYFFGRLGNFFNGELYGRVTNSPLGMYFLADPLVRRHPSQLYEALLEGIVLFCVLWWLRQKKLPVGSLFSLYLICYGIARIFVEFLRQPDQQLGFICWSLTMGQILSALMVLVGIGIFFWRRIVANTIT